MTAHVTGGGSLDVLLDAYEAADKEKSIRDRRFTVTHGNFPNPQAIARAKKLGVVFDCQPAWHYFDDPAVKEVLGPLRMRDFQPFRSLFDAGVVVAGGPDHMIGFDARKAINPYHPFFGMWMAITRQTMTERIWNRSKKSVAKKRSECGRSTPLTSLSRKTPKARSSPENLRISL